MIKFFSFTLFIAVVIILWRGLSLHPNEIPSPLIGQPAPSYTLPTLFNATTATEKDLLDTVTLVNVWASWCSACEYEHDFLLTLAHDYHVNLYGINYKDDPADAKNFLEQHGNPYKIIAVDSTGIAAINWGVYGTPETFVIDKKGRIRYKQIGPITNDIWETILKPLVARLNDE